MIDNYYRTLGLDNFATIDEVKRAYRLLAKKYHPDRNPNKEDVFKRVNEANSILSDAEKKALYDEKLSYSLNPRVANPYQPKAQYQTRPSYGSTKYEYSKRVKVYGIFFVIGLLSLCIGGPIALSYYSGNYAYEEGLKFQNQHNYADAAREYQRAIKYFSSKSGKASIQLSRLCLNDLNLPNRAIQYADKGLEYTEVNTERAELYYIKAKAMKADGQAKLAKTIFLKSLRIGYNADSINLNIGLLEAFYLNEFDSALVKFEGILNKKIVSEEVIFGKAWCLQKIRKHEDAISVFNMLIESYPYNGPGYYYKGLSELTLGDSAQACNSIKKANELNYPLASKIIEFVCL
ncbi:DnaJ domain-containing protein [Fulvivirga lutimaris]|uniref:DnaJ domain-containing protein n=1 Tax=Fulvivirga lutimaris TaxID=1819566 RepID=UPI0012BCB64A|nr:DnaJ domain-containing protein [Fulvivirga lutimaris]MTI39350.1 tetratricopeptide repeat protein [Fulvivirga lutimaris]